MNWHKIVDENNKKYYPKENGQYLICYKYCDDLMYDVGSYTNDLSTLNEYDFPADEYSGKFGFYDLDTEWSYFPLSKVYAWAEIEPYKEEEI